MKDFEISRRRFGFLMAGVAASTMLPFSLRAAGAATGGSAVAATFPGNWEDAYRNVLTPVLKKQGFDLTIAPAMAQDQLAKIMASPRKSALRHPADVAGANDDCHSERSYPEN